MVGWFKCKGEAERYPKDIWRLLDDAKKASYDDSPWALMLNHFGCYRSESRRNAPCPCVWRRGPMGPQAKFLGAKEFQWDWRDAKTEMAVRLALAHRS